MRKESDVYNIICWSQANTMSLIPYYPTHNDRFKDKNRQDNNQHCAHVLCQSL